MAENEPKITVIIATYNSAKTLNRCLDSFARQDYPHKELVISDPRQSRRPEFVNRSKRLT